MGGLDKLKIYQLLKCVACPYSLNIGWGSSGFYLENPEFEKKEFSGIRRGPPSKEFSDKDLGISSFKVYRGGLGSIGDIFCAGEKNDAQPDHIRNLTIKEGLWVCLTKYDFNLDFWAPNVEKIKLPNNAILKVGEGVFSVNKTNFNLVPED